MQQGAERVEKIKLATKAESDISWTGPTCSISTLMMYFGEKKFFHCFTFHFTLLDKRGVECLKDFRTFVRSLSFQTQQAGS